MGSVIFDYVTKDQERPKVITFGSPAAIVRKVQIALNGAGAGLAVDGDFGSATEAAVTRFQASEGLHPVGYVGPKTAAKLDASLDNPIAADDRPNPVMDDAPWLGRMRAITGVKEVPGDADSPIIMSWKAKIAKAFPDLTSYTQTYTHDSIPWCGFCMADVMAESGIRPVNGFLYARNWSRFGTRLTKPITGCVMVFSRVGGGHVSLLEKMGGRDYCYIRGGNQSDMVNVTRKSMDSFISAQWPPGWKRADIEANISNATAEGSEA
jgi:uncharacterized protein (TIGR02594 family)